MDEIRYTKAFGVECFENTNIMIHEESFYMSKRQIGELFEASDKEVNKAIKQLNESPDLLSVNEIVSSSQGDNIEYYRLESVVSIGMKININKAYRFQNWSYRQLINMIINKSNESKRLREDNYNLCISNARLRRQLDLIR